MSLLQRLFAITLVLLLSFCASAPPSGVMAPHCGKTPVQESDMQIFGFNPVPGKIVVMRVFATWCPFCKNDLARISEEFKSGRWSPDSVNLFLLAYRNHSENRQTFDAFVKEKLARLAIPRDAIQIKYLDRTYAEMLALKSATGQSLFPGWKGVPFGLVFGKDKRLAFRGHFTMTDVYENEHYKFIAGLQNEDCKP